MTFSSVRTVLQKNGRVCSNIQRRSLSAAKSATSADSSSDSGQKQQHRRLIPTRHSSKGPPPVCRDATELKELTQELLETPVGTLFCQGTIKASSSIIDDRDEAYGLAHESSEKVEYLLRGYNHRISPLTLCGNNKVAASDPDAVSASLETMMDLLERFHREGEMYLQLRREASAYGDSSSSDSSSDGSSSSSESSDSENDDFSSQPIDHSGNDPRFSDAVKDKLKVDARDQQQKLKSGIDDFAIPGATTAMYDTILDAMACGSQILLDSESGPSSASFLQTLEPDDIYHVAGAAWKAHDLNNQYNNGDLFFACTTPTMVTYNAALRGIGNICMAPASDENQKAQINDQGLAHGFGVYNQLTHNDHGLPKRNGASIIYLLNIIKACIPPSRTRGNMTVALWHQASMEGLVTPELIQSDRKSVV